MLQAVVDQTSFHYMIFEYTDQVDLHEYLVLNSPGRNSTKRDGSDSHHHAFSSIDNVDFMEMAVQVSTRGSLDFNYIVYIYCKAYNYRLFIIVRLG